MQLLMPMTDNSSLEEPTAVSFAKMVGILEHVEVFGPASTKEIK
jgi:hypothetical protein